MDPERTAVAAGSAVGVVGVVGPVMLLGQGGERRRMRVVVSMALGMEGECSGGDD